MRVTSEKWMSCSPLTRGDPWDTGERRAELLCSPLTRG